MDDQTLIRNYCQRQDSESAALLFGRYEHGLYNFIWQMLRHDQDTEDAHQETLRKALGALARYRPECQFKSWLYRIGHHESVNVIRKRRRVVLHETPEELSSVENGLAMAKSPELPSAQIDRKERARALQEAIAQLPQAEREIVILRLHEEMPFKEIAAILDAPLGTVLARMHHAKKHLRSLLQPVLVS